jgi:hypothetical protein
VGLLQGPAVNGRIGYGHLGRASFQLTVYSVEDAKPLE